MRRDFHGCADVRGEVEGAEQDRKLCSLCAGGRASCRPWYRRSFALESSAGAISPSVTRARKRSVSAPAAPEDGEFSGLSVVEVVVTGRESDMVGVAEKPWPYARPRGLRRVVAQLMVRRRQS